MFCVVKCETPPVVRWKLCEFQHRKSISISGINFIVWRGLLRSCEFLFRGVQVSLSFRSTLKKKFDFDFFFQVCLFA